MSSRYLERAKYAYLRIEEYKNKHVAGNFQSKLKSYAKSIPAYIKMNGLLQTIAFVNTKKVKSGNADGEAYQFLYDIIVDWVMQTTLKSKKELFNEKKTNLTEVLTNLAVDEYKNTEKEIMNLFCWVRRFAEGELTGEPGVQDPE